MLSNLPRAAFEHMRRTFSHKLTIDSEWVILHRLSVLSGVQPVWYDCCVNSCIAFTTKYQHHNACPHCHEKRYRNNGEARRLFAYLPLIPQLQGFFQKKELIQPLSYRANYIHNPLEICDVFDGSHYQRLLRHHVVIDGKKQSYRYFSDRRDLALGLCLDAYLLFSRNRGGPSATPILLENYNLDPHIRTQLKYLICVGIIPGPRQPKDVESFTAPLDNDLALLAHGVPTYDPLDNCHFPLRAYALFKLGDIIAIEKLLGIKGHNGFCPCRSCTLKGIRNVTGHGKVYYIPLTLPHGTSRAVMTTLGPRDPFHLPKRTHNSFLDVLQMMEVAETRKECEAIAKEHGIRQAPAIGRVQSIDYAKCAPWEWMHLVLENVIPNLVNLWTGKFKGLDMGSENYEIAPEIWEEIGRETAEATRNIPSAFVRVLGNIAEDRSQFTAESWCFWFIYLAPILLRNRFPS